MKDAADIRGKIEQFEYGYVFTYDDFNVAPNQENVLKKNLSRLVQAGKIIRLSKGRFYKPKKGIVSNLKPDEYEIVKDLLKDGDKIIGYITGYSIFNALKLTTQVPNVIQIGSNFDKKGIKRNIYTIKFVRQWNKITQSNIPLLQLLDCVRFIKNIPDTSIDNSVKRLLVLFSELSDSDKKQITELATNYPPSSRALTGAILEKTGNDVLADKLYKSLKLTSTYKLNISNKILPNTEKWRIQ